MRNGRRPVLRETIEAEDRPYLHIAERGSVVDGAEFPDHSMVGRVLVSNRQDTAQLDTGVSSVGI